MCRKGSTQHHPDLRERGTPWRVFDALLLGLGSAVFAWGWWRVAQSEFAWPWWWGIAIVGLAFALRRAWEPLALMACGLGLYAQWMGYDLFLAESDSGGAGPVLGHPTSMLGVVSGLLAAAAVAFVGLLRSWVGRRRRRGVALGLFVGMGALLWGYQMLGWATTWQMIDIGLTWHSLGFVGWVRLALNVAGMTCLWGCVSVWLARAGRRRLAIAFGAAGLVATLWCAGSMREGVISPREYWQACNYPCSTTVLAPRADVWRPGFDLLGEGRYVYQRRGLDEQDLREWLAKIRLNMEPDEYIHLASYPFEPEVSLRDLAAAAHIVREAGLGAPALWVKPPLEPRSWTMRLLDVAFLDGPVWSLPLPEIGEGGEVVIDGAASWQDLVDLLDEHREQGIEIERLSIVE